MTDDERSGSCQSGARCRMYDAAAKRSYPQWPLCGFCLEGAERDVRALTLDYRDLEQHLPPSLGVWGNGMPRGKGASAPLPIDEYVLSLQQDIWFLTDAWDAVVRDFDRLSDKPPRTRAGWAVQQSVSILAPRLDRLAQTSGTMWDYPGATDRCSEVPGWQGVLDLAHLHSRARHALGLSRDEGELCVGVICPKCDLKSKLVRDTDRGGVTCKACKTQLTAEQYADWVGLLYAAQHRQEEAA